MLLDMRGDTVSRMSDCVDFYSCFDVEELCLVLFVRLYVTLCI